MKRDNNICIESNLVLMNIEMNHIHKACKFNANWKLGFVKLIHVMFFEETTCSRKGVSCSKKR